MNSLIKRQIITEKSVKQMEEGKYSFLVSDDANKAEIKKAIEVYFEAKIAKINVLNRKGKKRERRNKSRIVGRTVDQKKVIVTLAKDSKTEKIKAIF
jgi:large subunit ribosomal protein L23